MTTLALICGGITALLLAYMAVLFWRDPEHGMRQTTHKLERLPEVMADRYTAFAFLALVFTLLADLRALAVLMVACAFMGLADGWIYSRRGLPHWKHTVSGILSLIALGVTILAIL